MTQEDVGVIVIEDVNSMRIQIKDLLKQFGFRKIRTEDNAEKAKLAMELDKYHLILCDWHMEPITGMDFLKYIRAHPTHKDTAFIMVTAESTKERVIDALKCGVDDYLLKPLTIMQIQNKVYGVLLKRNIL